MIWIENIAKDFGRGAVLDDVSLEIEAGETFVIVGPSGTGKSVLLKHMIGLLTPDRGRVFIGDDLISEARGDELARIRERFGVLFQGGALMQWLNVLENVALPLRERTNMGEEEILNTAREKLRMVGMENDADKYPSEISGGMRKRAGLARAIVRNPEIILYDEPTSGLDPVSSRTIDRLIADLRDQLHATSVVVTHDLHSALSIGTRIAMLYGGHVLELATPQKFIESEVPEVRLFLEAQYITKTGAWERGST